jgi:hypothetical protein
MLTLEAAQLIYMHIFLLLDPMPYLEFIFLDNMKYFHFLFFPSMFDSVLGDYSSPATPQQYKSFLTDTTFLRQSSAYIILFAVSLLFLALFKLLSNKTVNRSKCFRKFCEEVYRERIRFALLNDTFWITFLYTVFFAMFQFKSTDTTASWMVGNLVFAALTICVYLGYTIFTLYIGFKYRNDVKEVPKKYGFLTNEACSTPL